MNQIVEIENLDELKRALVVLPDKFQRRAILPILRKSSRPLIRAAKSKLLGYGGSYANLAKSIGNITAKSRNPIIYVGPRTKGKFKYIGYIAHWVEYGTKGIKVSRGGSAQEAKDIPYAINVAKVPRGGKYREDQPAKPFMRPTIDQQKPIVLKTLAENLKKDIDKQIKRLVPKLK